MIKELFLKAQLTPSRVIVFISLSMVIGISGPLGTFTTHSLPVRVIYWGTIVATAMIVSIGVRVALTRYRPDLQSFVVSLAVSIALAISLTPVVWLMLHPHSPLAAGFRLPTLGLYLIIWGISLFGDILCITIPLDVQQAQIVARPPLPRLTFRLPENVQGDILMISASDHLVSVQTVRGVATVRMRLRDAIGEMDAVAGLYTHRSYWVALGAVAGRCSENGRPVLLLTDGTRVPVSRKYQPQVESAGLL